MRTKIYEEYDVNWLDIQQRADPIQQSLSVTWKSLINEGVDRCGENDCTLMSATELDIFMLYCSQDMSACNLPTYTSVPQ